MFSFGKNKIRNIAVVDLGSTSVGAAYATYSGVASPTTVFSVRLPVEAYGTGTTGALRTLDAVAKEMTAKGATRLHEATGSGAIEEVVVLIESPWQTSKLSVSTITKEKPFLFTKNLLSEAMPEKGRATVVATVLNGYETLEPVGKQASRAEIAVLSSHIDPEVERLTKRAVRSFTGAAPLRYVAFADAVPQVLKDFFPHEREFLALSIGETTTDVAFIKQGHLAGFETAPAGSAGFYASAKSAGVSARGVVDGIIDTEKNSMLQKRVEEATALWVQTMRDTLLTVAAEGALPRTLFVFCDERTLPLFKRLLDASELHTLWLSDEPLSIIPMNKASLAASVQKLDERVENDPILDLLCLLSRVDTRKMVY